MYAYVSIVASFNFGINKAVKGKQLQYITCLLIFALKNKHLISLVVKHCINQDFFYMKKYMN